MEQGNTPYAQILIGALMGIIPGCLGTYTIVSLYIHRVVNFPALMAALIATAGDEARINEELVEELERDARTAAMAASVPTIHFPDEENEKYYSSGKYGYA